MMEFALALPILLTLLYGVLETGRLLFIYASTITAARQAVRYGSATGKVGAVPGGYVDLPFYQYCEGIRGAAKNVGFINRFEDANIIIKYDNGVNPANGNPVPISTPDPTCDSGTFTEAHNGNRIIVEVSTQWEPIVNFLPFKPFEIKSSSERTIIAAISIAVTPLAQNSGLLILSVVPSKTTYSAKDELIEFAFTLTNSSGATAALTGAYQVVTTINGSAVTLNCTNGAPASIAPGASYLCTEKYIYAVTQPNLDAGSFTSSSVGTAGSATSTPVTKTFTAIQLPKLELSITTNSTVGSKGTVITYTYSLKNIGNVSLTSPYTIIGSNKFSSVDCSGVISPLAPGIEKPCTTTTYTIKDEDINAGSVVNTATATAKSGSATITSEPASATVLTPPLILLVSASSSSDLFQIITYTYRIINNSGSNLRLQGVTATANGSCLNVTISNGNECSFTETYTTTTTDYDTVTEIVRQSYASAIMTDTGQTLNSTTVTTRVALKKQQALTISINPADVTSTQPAGSMIAGTTTVTFKYFLANNGNVTLVAPFTVDNGAVNACGTITSLATLASGYCSVTYIVSASDLAAGSFTKTATASGYFGGTKITSAGIDTRVFTYSGARFSITASGLQSSSNIIYTYTITNTGSVDIKSPYTVTLNHADNGSNDIASWTVTCPNNTLTPGGSTTCTSTKIFSSSGNYTVTVTSAIATIVTGGTVPATTPLPSVTVSTYICTTTNLTLNVSSADLKGSKLIQQFTITNNVGAPLHLKSLEFNWKTTNGGLPVKLSSVSLFPGQGATKLWFWTGTDSDGYFNSSTFLTSPVTINAGTTELKLTFTNASLTVTGLKLYFVESELGCGSRVYN